MKLGRTVVGLILIVVVGMAGYLWGTHVRPKEIVEKSQGGAVVVNPVKATSLNGEVDFLMSLQPAPRFIANTSVMANSTQTTTVDSLIDVAAKRKVQSSTVATRVSNLLAPPVLGAGMATRAITPGGLVSNVAAIDRILEANVRNPNSASSSSQPPVSAPDWTVVGAVQRGNQSYLLVQFVGQPSAQMFKLGDLLPGGGRVAWVSPNALGVSMSSSEKLNLPILDGQSQDELARAAQARKKNSP